MLSGKSGGGGTSVLSGKSGGGGTSVLSGRSKGDSGFGGSAGGVDGRRSLLPSES